MKRVKELLAAAAFVGLTLTRMLFPNVGEGVRGKLHSALVRESDYVAAFRDFGKKLSHGKDGEKPALAVAAQAQSEPLRQGEAQPISYYVEDASVRGETEALPQETPLPAAVAAFLEQQAAFSDYALPDNVDYSFVSLPFDYALPVAGRRSSGFGYRLHPILNTVRFHFGTDVAADAGDSIVAFADAAVCSAGYDESFGWHLKLDHGGGWISHYCHCSRLLVQEGQTVCRGETVALVGATGLATGPHLHFELTKDGVFLNPEYYLNL